MRNLILAALIIVASIPSVFAGFASDVVIINDDEIAKLSDEKLVDTYVDTLVDIEANKTFHTTSGFSPKDFREFKDTIKFRYKLITEIHKRGLEIPQFDRFSN